MKKNQQILTSIFFCILLFLSFLISLTIGSVKIPLDHSYAILLDAVGINTNIEFTLSEQIIILQIRLPRVIMAVLVGAMLSMAGVASQNLFKNPIADPYVIGISSSAGFGAALTAIMGWYFLAQFTSPFISFFTATISVVIVYSISKKNGKIQVYSLLLSGVALSYIFSALISFILYLSENQAHMILSILMGNFWGSSWDQVIICIIFLIPVSMTLFFYGLDMNLLLTGDESAKTMGVNVNRSKKVIVFCMIIFSAIPVAFCGTIGFVGLIIPHIARAFYGSDNRKIIPVAAILGGILLIWADVLARSLIAPVEIPIGVFTSFMGGPFFIYLVIKRNSQPR
jgi:ABC-type Fe3+-siderophore transport system permease subunit